MAVSYDSRYSVAPGYIQSLPAYEAACHNVKMSGGIQIQCDDNASVICYNPYLIVLFSQHELPVWDIINKQDTIIDGGRFRKSFVKGFAEGKAEFERRFTTPQTVPYSTQEYTETLKRLYYGDGTDWPQDHCLRMKRWALITLERSQFERIGYWAGITFYIESLMDERPELFGTSITPTAAAMDHRFDSNDSQPKRSFGLNGYISEEYQEYTDELIPFLIARYKGLKPKDFAFMLWAMADLGLISRTALSANQTELHKALAETFGKVGTRASLNGNITGLNSANNKEEQSIRHHKELIKGFLQGSC